MFSRRPPLRRLSAAVLGAAGFGALLAGSIGPAQAQFFDWFTPRPVVVEPSPAVPAPEIYRRLNGRGYQLNGNMQRNGGVYLADVVDSRGRQQRLVIDAYRGKILQSYATAPPRPSAGLPPGGAFTMVPPPGTYASRDPMAPPPSTIFPGQPQPRMVPGFEARRPAPPEPRQVEDRHSKKKTKAATRESEPKPEPKALRGKHHPAASPAEATAPPAEREPTTASVPTTRPDTGSSVPAKAAIAPQAEPAPAPAPAPAATTASSAPVRAPAPAPSAPAANKPGYANGVPINPLD